VKACVLVLLLALAAPTVAVGQVIEVPGDFPTIQAAVHAAPNLATILVASGRYLENVHVTGKKLVFRSEAGAALTVLDGGGAGPALTGDSGLDVDGFTVTGGGDGLVISAGSAFSIENCVFTGNSGWGLLAQGGLSGFPVSKCLFFGNGLGGARLSVSFYDAFTMPLLFDCIFAGDGLQIDAGFSGIPDVRAQHCSFDGGSVVSAGAVIFWSCIVRAPVQAPVAINASYSDVQGGAAGDGVIDADPQWTNPAALDYSLQPGSPCINTGFPILPKDPDGSVNDMGAVSYNAWTDLGGGVAGAAGSAVLSGQGPLTDGSTLTLALAASPPATGVLLLAGASALGAPFKGGVLWPVPSLVIGPLLTSAAGGLQLSGSWPSGLPSGTGLWAQVWWTETGAPFHAAASNGVRGLSP
jgi:hypothetical protein